MSFSPCPPDALAGKVIQEQRDRWERKRSQAGRELVLSEQRYCQQLELVITYFVEILKAKGTLKQDIRESIFSSIKAIHSVNQSLLVHLESGDFGRGFEHFCPQLHHYNVYVDNIYNAQKVLGIQLKKNKAFRRFKKLQEARPEFREHKLEDLLQLPIERIHRYKGLLQEMTANTSPDNPEFQQLSRAAAAVEDLQHRIRSNGRRRQNHLQLRRVQKLLKGSQSQVLAAGRWYIREGWLKVVPAKGSDAKARMFFLFSDMLLRAKPRATDGQKFAGEHAYPLRECTVEKVFGNTKGKGGLLSLTFAKAKLLLMSSDPEDFNDWYQSLSSAVRKLRPESTLVLGREDREPGPLGSAPGGPGDDGGNRKRNMVSNDPGEATGGATSEWDSSAPKRIKEDAWDDSWEASTSTCVLL
ncbi:rho guanine nucleotide exchange factor 39 [Stigmatopora argus]